MKKPELLSPVGDFECLKAAVQNGADAVYLGGSLFNARNSATNFNDEDLKEAIKYAKLRNVKVNLALNILIKNEEFIDAFNLAKKAYEYGVDAIIVQDLGLAKSLIDSFPNLPIHASTQMTAHSLENVLELQKLGFKRVVLSRELPISEIKFISENSNVELEVFIHGALCISYSGQCLFSSMVGGRSGNRGKCAQPCRLPYELYEDETKIDNGYLLSPKDLCSIDNIEELINAGIDSFKIEGRMKTPEYVATVTRIYKKYINSIIEKTYLDNKCQNDKTDLMQVFNRGGFSTGHQNQDANTSLIYKEKANNMGIYIGDVYDFNSNKGHIKITLKAPLCLGDTVSINNSRYTISELMIENKNIQSGNVNEKVTFGRAKGDIKKGNKIYKLESKALNTLARESYSKENKKIHLSAKIEVEENIPIKLTISCIDANSFYTGISHCVLSSIIPEKAISVPITKDRIISQISKTGNTEFEFTNIDVILGNDLFIPNISSLNDLRRTALAEIEDIVMNKNRRNSNITCSDSNIFYNNELSDIKNISLLLNILNIKYDYTVLKNIDNVYIPYNYFTKPEYEKTIVDISSKFNLYIYLPTISRKDFLNFISSTINTVLNKFKIKGFVISNFGQLNLVSKYNLDNIANYSFNIYNNNSIDVLNKLGFSKLTISPELDKPSLVELSKIKNSELIAYGNLPLMNLNYCLLGKSNKCYKECNKPCQRNSSFKLKDRLGINFEVIPDKTRCVTTIYNSKTLSINLSDFKTENYRIDILNEDINSIQLAINSIISGIKLEGKDFTNGNLNRII